MSIDRQGKNSGETATTKSTQRPGENSKHPVDSVIQNTKTKVENILKR
jgi:hypothetical protein